MKTLIKINNRYTGELIFEFECKSIVECVLEAIKQNKNLRSADLRSADLRYADLSYADLSYADLRSADLRYADLRYADLSYADLRSADLRLIKADFFDVLLRGKKEIKGLKKAVIEGKINGSTYEGECACLVGTIANVRKVYYKALVNLKPDSGRPAERFFLAIKKGDTPKNNKVSKIVLEWIEEFEELLKA